MSKSVEENKDAKTYGIITAIVMALIAISCITVTWQQNKVRRESMNKVVLEMSEKLDWLRRENAKLQKIVYAMPKLFEAETKTAK